MLVATPLTAKILGAPPLIDWCNPQSYAYTQRLSRDAWAWEFLRRNPDYRAAWAHMLGRASRVPSLAARWFGLVTFEDPDRTAAEARCLWLPDVSSLVLPVWAEHRRMTADAVAQDLSALRPRAAVHLTDGAVQHVLFTEEGRRLQLLVHGEMLFGPVLLTTDCLVAPAALGRRLLLLRRVSDFMAYGRLAPTLYPPEPRAWRLTTVLRALDGSLAQAPLRAIAEAVFEPEDIAAGQRRSTACLKQVVRRAVRHGRWLMQDGYLSLLK